MADSVVTVPVKQQRALIKDYERTLELNAALRNSLRIADMQLRNRDSIVRAYDDREMSFRNTIIGLESLVENERAQKVLAEKWVQDINKSFKRQRRLKWLAIIGGAVSTGAAIYLLK